MGMKIKIRIKIRIKIKTKTKVEGVRPRRGTGILFGFQNALVLDHGSG